MLAQCRDMCLAVLGGIRPAKVGTTRLWGLQTQAETTFDTQGKRQAIKGIQQRSVQIKANSRVQQGQIKEADVSWRLRQTQLWTHNKPQLSLTLGLSFFLQDSPLYNGYGTILMPLCEGDRKRALYFLNSILMPQSPMMN